MDMRFISAAALLAGALALAGCGGGNGVTPASSDDDMKGTDMSDSGMDDDADDDADADMDDDKTDMDDDKTNDATSRDYRSVTPIGANVNVNTAGTPAGLIGAGAKRTIPGSNVTLECKGTEDCAYRVTEDGDILATGMVDASIPTPPTPSDPQADGHWLTGKNLVTSLNSAGTMLGVTVNDIKLSLGINKDTGTALNDDRHGDEKVTGLRLQHNRDSNSRDFLVWGVWEEPVDGGDNKYHQVATGSMEYKGTFPAKGTGIDAGKATYFGESGFHGFANGKAFTTDVRLVADFRAGNRSITGAVGEFDDANDDTPSAPTIAGVTDLSHIALGKTSIGATMKGSATIVGGSTSDSAQRTPKDAPSSGAWNAGFFGPETGAPTGVAGSVSVTRPAAPATSTTGVLKPHSKVGKLSVNGAFGAER